MRRIFITAMIAFLPLAAHAQPLSLEQQRTIDESVTEWLAKTEAPSVSIAVVRGNDVVYAKAYGYARLDPKLPATVDTRYEIDSVSKQFTAAAILILQQQGKLSLDDKVAKYFPDLASADKVTIRQLLNMTAGYIDYSPQDFITPEQRRPTTTAAVLAEWATKPLAFEPGTRWQYSNTNFKIAGAIVEKVSGQPLIAFLRSHIFVPLKMRATEDDSAPLRAPDAALYARRANGPIRRGDREETGWRIGAGALSMSPTDLARWYISLMNRSLLSQSSYDALYTPTKLKDGSDTTYSLGLEAWRNHGRLGLGHAGGNDGSRAEARCWPSEKIAIVVLTNDGWADPGAVIGRIANVVLPPTAPEALARAVLAGFQNGEIDRKLFSDNANAFLTPAVLADQKAGLASLGSVRMFSRDDERERGGMHVLFWKIVTTKTTLTAVEIICPDGKLEQFNVFKSD